MPQTIQQRLRELELFRECSDDDLHRVAALAGIAPVSRESREGSGMRKAAGLEYEEHGSGEPVLLVHGAIVTDAMLPLARDPALAERHRVIRYRRRGHGGSDPMDGPFTPAGQARDAVALLGDPWGTV